MTPTPDAAALINLVHGALYGESSWQDFLERARHLVPNGQALLFFHDAAAGTGAYSLSAGIDESTVTAYDAHYSRINPWMPHAAVRPLGRVVQAENMVPRQELIRSEHYNDFLKPQDIQTGFGATIRRDGGCNYLFSILCAEIDGDEARKAQEALQAVLPHLSQAFDYYRHRGEMFGQGQELLEGAALGKARGVVHVGQDMRILCADDEARYFAEESGCLSIKPFERFACSSADLSECIAAGLSGWHDAAFPRTRVFHLPRPGGALPLRVSVFLPGDPGAVFRGPECILLIEDPASALNTAAEEFGAIHGLSRAERRVVATLAHGHQLEEAAVRIGVSVNTVRTQLKNVFARTGLKRQTELVRHVCIMAGGPSVH